MPKNLITKPEACAMAGVKIRTLENWLHDGKITKHVNGLGQVRVDLDELKTLLEFRPVTPAVESASR